ncbi:MAG: CapA family protein [Brevefilum sp.]|nr:CapA family protein [Brevefilum sp.]
MRKNKQKLMLITLLGVVLLSGCRMPLIGVEDPSPYQEMYVQIQRTLAHSGSGDNPAIVSTPFQTTDRPRNEEEDDTSNLIFIQNGLPESLQILIDNTDYSISDSMTDSDVQILINPEEKSPNANLASKWLYVLAAPFYTITDNISFDNLSALWQGEQNSIQGFSKILVTEPTLAAVNTILGKADQNSVAIVNNEEMISKSLGNEQVLFITPFDELDKVMKVIRIEGKSPIDSDFEQKDYPLSAAIWIEANTSDYKIDFPANNYDPDQRTVLIMTGVTALTRATAHRMEINGNEFPGQDIHDWLTSADLTHISNEVPFALNCPAPDPNQPDLIFCSSPDRIELLEYIGADIIELTGNHLLDYGLSSINLTLEMYEERDWHYYAGGWDLNEAQSPRLITHNNNKLAFIGCNPVGPPNVWATNTSPGAAPCGDFSWMIEEIEDLKAEGYLPIVTMQYAEDYTDYPSGKMVSDFEMLAKAGAIVINGSQAHTPKMMTFNGESFIHYGLGNLFFDQMEVYYGEVYMPNTREEFIDRLVFYDGELISIELLTALLEDYARPRPMTESERYSFLSRIFSTAINFGR